MNKLGGTQSYSKAKYGKKESKKASVRGWSLLRNPNWLRNVFTQVINGKKQKGAKCPGS